MGPPPATISSGMFDPQAPRTRLARSVVFFGLLASLGALVIAGCGGEADDDPPPDTQRYEVTFTGPAAAKARGGTLFTLTDAEGRVRLAAGLPSTWNTYCGSQLGEVHFYVVGEAGSVSWQPISKPDPLMRTAYAFARDGLLHVRDLGNERSYLARPEAEFEKANPWQPLSQSMATLCGVFTVGALEYRHEGDEILACPAGGHAAACDRIAIHAQTFPYVFAEANGRVLVATNWGDVLIHRAGRGWCRAVLQGHRLACPVDASLLPILMAPTGFQFYSSARFGSRTLLGRWPGGRIYEFDGDAVLPHDDEPMLPDDDVTANAEAQSMALYCGNLYVGYWPRGDLWMRSQADGAWHRAGRAFSHPAAAAPAVPYINNPLPDLDAAFLGQRITSLTPHGDSLYLTTSNLRGWHKFIPAPEFLTVNQVAEYGSVWRLHQPGCATGHLKSAAVVTLQFDISPTEIRIRQDRKTLAVAANPGVMPADSDRMLVGQGVFGHMGGPVTVKRIH